jgi:hypothetical protein
MSFGSNARFNAVIEKREIFRIIVDNRVYHYLSQSEIADAAKRIYQQLAFLRAFKR